MYKSLAAASGANPILVALRTEVAGSPPQHAAAIVARWFSDLTVFADVHEEVGAPIRQARRVLRLLVLRWS